MMKMGRMCLNWQVLVGLGMIGIGIWAFAPGLFLAALPILLLAACPLSMLVMMWGMKRVMHSGDNAPQPSHPSLPTGQGLARDARLADLKTQQAAIGREIAEIESEDPRAIREAETVHQPNDRAGRSQP